MRRSGLALTALALSLVLPTADAGDTSADVIHLAAHDFTPTTTLFQPDGRYRVTVSGTIDIVTVDGQGRAHHGSYDPFYYCTEGNCAASTSRIRAPGLLVRYTDQPGTSQHPLSFSSAPRVPAFRADHTYVMVLDTNMREGKLLWTALPYTDEDADYTGLFRVQVEDLAAPRQTVGFNLRQKLTLDGRTVIASAGKGTFELRDRIKRSTLRDDGNDGSRLSFDTPVTLRHAHQPDPTERVRRLDLRVVSGHYLIQIGTKGGASERAVVETLKLKVVVSRSNARGCKAGSPGIVSITEVLGGRARFGVEIDCPDDDREVFADGKKVGPARSEVDVRIKSPDFD